MKVLIVEDQVSVQFQLVEQLQSNLKIKNSDIRIANNGLEAIRVVEQNNLDIILMDLQMPVMNGLIATKRIINKYPHIKIIVISSFHDKISLQKSSDAGAKGYLLKKNITTSLISVIQNIVCGYTVFPKDELDGDNFSFDFNSIILPNKSDKILKINKIIASEIIKQWTDEQKNSNLTENSFLEHIDQQELFNHLLRGSSNKCNLIEELNLRFEYLIKNFDVKIFNNDNFESEFDKIFNQLNYWFYTDYETPGFSSFQVKLQANAQVFRIGIAKQFKQGKRKKIRS